MDIRKIEFVRHGNSDGSLVAIEELKDVPFQIRRVYYIYDVAENVIRGHHAHKSLEQVLICVHGSCKIRLDNGTESETVILDKPNEGLYVSNAVWREMSDFSQGAVLMVLASKLYDESDYIRDYNEYLRYMKDLEENCTGNEV